MPVDGKPTTLIFDGEIVGEVQSVTMRDGSVAQVAFRASCDTKVRYAPGMIDEGMLTVSLYRDARDVGQNRMSAARSARLVLPFSATLDDGSTLQGEAFVVTMPTISPTDDVNTGTATLRITSVVE